MVKSSTTNSPKIHPMNAKQNRNYSTDSGSHEKIPNSLPSSKSVDTKYNPRIFEVHLNHTGNSSPRDNSAILRAVSAQSSSISCGTKFATTAASRQNKYSYQTTFGSNEMFEQQIKPNTESNQKTFSKYDRSYGNGNGITGSR